MFKTKLEVDRHVDHSLKKINNETERNLRCFSFAKLYFNVGDYEQTCRYVSSYLSVKPKSPEGYQLLGKALEKLGKKEAALEAYRTSLQLDPKQNNLVIKVCELLASDDVDMDQSGARYFCDLAQSFDPHNPAVFNLRERLITTESDNPVEVSKLLIKELETRPTDVNLRVRLLKHFLQNNMIKEAYKHASAIEEKNLSIFHNNLSWYETFAEVLVRFQRDLAYTSQLTWEFWFLSVSVLDRLVALSLDEHLDTVKTSTEYVTAVFNFDQMLSKASQNIQTCPDRQLITVFLSHYHAQLYFHFATLLFKQAKKDLIQFKEASNISLPVLLAAYHSSPPDLQSMWLLHSPENRKRLVHHWHKEACYRCSQSGHILLAAARDRKTIMLEKATQYSTGMWREQLYKKVFVKRDQQLKMSTSYFVSGSQTLEPVIKLPDPLDVIKYDEVAQLVYPDSLHHYIWLGLNSKLSDMELKSFEGLQYSIKNLNNCAAEALNILDIQAFLYCAVLCAKSKLEDTKNLIYYNHDRPNVLPACVTDYLGTLNQSKFISAAYKMYKNEQGANMGEVRLLLIKAIEVVRCVGHHGMDVRLLVTLAKIFEERSKRLTKQSEVEFNDARAELFWKTALPLLEKVRSNQMITYSNNRLFEYKGKDITISEASSYIECGRLFTAVQLMKKKEYEKALHIFEQLKDPYASFYQSEIYKHMADQKTHQNKENVTSEMRSQNIILLSRARDCLYLTLDRLREPSVDRAHPLNSQLGTEIEKIERLLSRIDPDCTNRNECDGMSDENPSSDNSTGDHYLTTYTTHTSFHNGPPYTPKHENHNHSTPMRYNISRQEARPSPERLDAQIRQMAATRDNTLTSILEQIKIMVESHRSLLEELRSFKDTTVDDLRSVKKGFEELKDVKKSVEELKSSVDELQNVVDVVQEMKKEINELKNHTKNNQLSDEDLYVLDPDYGVDYNINSNIGAYNTNLPSVYPNYQPGRIGTTGNLAAYAPPGLYPGLYPGLTYAYGGLGLPQPGTLPFVPDQQLPPIAASAAASYTQPILGQPSLTQGLPSTSLGVGMLTGQILSHAVPHIAQTMKESPKTASAVASTAQSLFPSATSISTSTAINNKAAPVNVVITNSDPLPTIRATTSQPVLSVTIPPQHIKGNVAKSQPHNYQIPLPSTAVNAVASAPSVLSQPPPAISTESLLSNVSPPVFSAVAQTKSPSKNVSLGLQIEKTLDQTFSPDKNNLTLNRSNISTNSVDDHDPCPDFKPIIPLPDEVPINTGEECETELFCERAKLFRHVNNNGVKEWKERGVGNLKILHNPSSGKIRILMRRDQVHKICANHFITKDMLLTPMANNDRAYIWAAHDFADESVVLEKFCVRFKTSEEAKKFRDSFESAKKLIQDPAVQESTKKDTNIKKGAQNTSTNIPGAISATTSLGGFVFTSTPTFKPKDIVTPAKVVETEQTPKTSPFSSFTFGKSTAVTPNVFKPVQTTEATTFSPLVISQNKPTTPQNEDEDSHAEEFVPTAEFKPVIALPELIDHKTGEENSEILFEGRAKLFRYDTNGETKEWKERGIGIIKILKDESVRLLMRRDQVLKVCCNHKVLKNMTFKLNTSNPKAVVWHAQDFSEGVLTPETFTVRFKTEEQANQFLQVLQTAQTSLDENNKVSGKHHKPESRPRTTSFGDKFKPAKGSWECKNCYIINEGKTNHCIACESPKPGTTAKKPEESGAVFSFGIPTSPTSAPTVEEAKSGGFSFLQKPALDTSKGISLETPGQKFTFGIPQATTVPTEPVKTFAFGTPTTATTGAATQFSFGTKSSLETTKASSIFTPPASTTFSFTPTTTTTPSTKSDSKFVFGSPQKHEFEFKPRSPRRVSAGQGDEESDGSYVEEEEDNIYFKPVIPLPDKVDVKTGEEDESVLYCHRAKLFRFVDGEWKERGLGDVKILQRKDNKKLRSITMPRKGKKRLTQPKGVNIKGRVTKKCVPVKTSTAVSQSPSQSEIVVQQNKSIKPAGGPLMKDTQPDETDYSLPDSFLSRKAGPSSSLAPALTRNISTDSENELPQPMVVEVMIHRTANDDVGQNFPGNSSSTTIIPAHPNNIPVRALTQVSQNVINVDMQVEDDDMLPELSPSLVDDIQNEFAEVAVNIQRHQANQVNAAIADAPLRENILQEIQRLRANGNHMPTYLMASERIVRQGPFNLGPLNQVCRHCSALYFHIEITGHYNQYTKCCQRGNVVLDNFPNMPDVLIALFQGFHPLSNLFKRHILSYNYAFQFVSLEANLRDLPRNRAPPVYCIKGKIYHHISNININEPMQRYGPIYFLDPDEAVNSRARNNNQILDRQLIALLEQLLREVNPYARAYMHLRERYQLEVDTIERLRAEALRNHIDPLPLQIPTVTLELLNVRGRNRRQYDLPRVEEIAAVYNLLPDTPATPNMRIYVRDEPTRLQNISEESELNDPLVFPLMFPHGEPGWYIGIPHQNDNRNVTLCEYYAYRFGIRDNDSRFKYGGRLTQQIAVTSYIKIENNRLKYILRNQERLRATEYVGLADYLHHRIEGGNDDDEATTLGRMIILPSSFIGSPRYQQQLFQDAMAVVARFGTPSLFITMTTNANWPEIVDNIPRGSTASDHPSLIDRVFQCKLNELMDDLLKRHIFGIPLANLYVIEFQKRGLPHCHNLMILRDEDKLTSPYKIDALISAEIPDPQTEPELYQIVTSFMVHGPCGQLNPDSVCMVDGKCSKNYPKDFNELTIISDNGQVIYRRRNNGRTITTRANGRNCILDNRWIVPYNPYILLKYKCHINAEACATTHCVKYLYKYLFKGVDMALVRINVEHQADYNEVEHYVNARYMTPPEACWHINQFATHKNTHTVYRLCVHLPDRQIVRFQPGYEIQALQNNESTQLTAWFTLNQNDVEARQYLYTDIPYHYVWQNATKRWKRRQRGADKIVVRMYSVSIRNQELYYLRLLLLHIPGARSYAELRTFNGITYDTFKECCQHRNLLADDTEWKRTLREACSRDMPYQLRNMFAFILIFCDVSDAPALWDEFQEYFMEDFKRRGLSDEEALQQTLRCIQTVLLLNGTRLASYGLPEPREIIINFDPINVEAERVQGQEMYENLNHEQRVICNAVMAAVRNAHEPNRFFLINAAAGSGKSYLFQTLISKLRGEELPVLVACPTGIAASILKGGRTLHSTFKLPFNINETTTSGIAPTTAEGRYIASVKLLIIDEVSMVTNLIFNIIERALRDICADNRPFGNKVILLGGDFRQTLPVVIGGNRCTIVHACIKGSRHWPLFMNYELQTNVRAIHNEEFARWLLNLGNSTIQPLRRTMYGNIIQIPSDCYVNNVDDLIEFCFNDLDPSIAIRKAILVPTNNTSHSINKKILQKLEGSSKTYCSVDSIDTTDDPAAEVANYTVEFLNSLTPNGLPPHRLELKKDAIVMLLRNLNLKKGLCNGTRLIVRLLGNQYIDAEKIDSSGRPTGERVFIPRIDLKTGGNDVLPFKLKRRQFPIRLAYTMTIHKSQGQTFEKVGIFLDEPVFTHGQLYVAFSRAKNLEDVKIYMSNRPEQGKLLPNSENVYTRNVVYREKLCPINLNWAMNPKCTTGTKAYQNIASVSPKFKKPAPMLSSLNDNAKPITQGKIRPPFLYGVFC